MGDGAPAQPWSKSAVKHRTFTASEGQFSGVSTMFRYADADARGASVEAGAGAAVSDTGNP